MTDITCRIIVMKDRQYYQGVAMFADGQKLYRFSPHAYDAKKFKTTEKAHKVAREIGGYVRMFDALSGDMI